jgi:hypothetical protein
MHRILRGEADQLGFPYQTHKLSEDSFKAEFNIAAVRQQMPQGKPAVRQQMPQGKPAVRHPMPQGTPVDSNAVALRSLLLRPAFSLILETSETRYSKDLRHPDVSVNNAIDLLN